jgi:hypothetical protein
MQRSPRTTLLALAPAVLALAAAGCGGSEVTAHEVPGPPPALTVPTDGELASGAADADADADPDATAEPDADAGTTEPDAGVVPEDSSGGAVAPETEEAPAVPEETTAPEETPPPAGSAPEQFESFCEQNAGAC